MSRRARRRAEAEEARWIGMQPEPDDSAARVEELLRQAKEQEQRKEGEEE